ncbi:MAG TPA: DHH family phosphoesterase [Methylomusa anaerophila]|uniref:Cyclic-di-AMP phosphodiesterase n=1 Tax=Methylomusa anaerophila TaxID=1930071 RepID=A0A348AHS1_9FIRM|nr:DHH family phosphoesterase [Methylomusa anaerophila]BBB90619.1 bifunctional oligoribonuclease and PAP phosphatase NrnA [Methylomusa anaerophila]HML88774.1 DHH family phosphoesterase [Methylomusa anaerophila]
MPQGPSFWFDTRVYLAVAAALLLVIMFYNPYVGVLGTILLYALYLFGRERHVERQKALNEYLSSMSCYVEEATALALSNLPLAIAIVDNSGLIHWRNSILAAWSDNPAAPNESLLKIFPDLDLSKIWDEAGQFRLESDSRFFDVIHKPIPSCAASGSDEPAQALMILYITDITPCEVSKIACQQARPVMAYIQIDNYDDALKGLSETQRTNILAEVSKHLSEWIAELGGFLKKFSEDTYLAMIDRKALEQVVFNDKFDILDKIRAIHGGNKIPVTLSLGVAAGDDSIAALSQVAQAGLDLALGRGGDQAAVNIDGKVQFFGGKAKAVEKNTRVKARIVAHTLRDLIDQADSVIVMGHAGEDFDSLGASLGVTRMVMQRGKTVNVVVSQPGLAVDKLSELLLDYEEYRELFISPAEAGAIISGRTLLFVVDTHRPELVAAPELINRTERIVVIDHHRRAETFIPNTLLVYLEPSASSASELVAELLMYFDDKLELNRLEASALYAGVVVDTKNFAVQTGVRTFEAASYLRRAGADPMLVRHLFRMDLETIKSRAAIIENTIMPFEGVVVAVCPPEVKNAQVLAAQSADTLLNIEGVKVSFVLFTAEDGIGVSARSNGDINVQIIMEQLGGGGHQSVAGAKIKNMTVDDIIKRIIALVADYMKESDQHEVNTATRSEKTR